MRNTPTKVPDDDFVCILGDLPLSQILQRHIRRLDHLIRSSIAVNQYITGGVLLQFITQLRCSRHNVVAELKRFTHAVHPIVIELLIGLVHLLDIFDAVGIRLIDDKIVDIEEAGLIEELCLLDKLPHRLCHWAAEEDEATIILKII